VVLLDVDGCWAPLLAQLQRMADDGYLEQRRLDALGVVPDAAGLLAFVKGYEHPPRKWADGTPPRP
jgi:predicted Rossmann-fold nucleotide-binding protein